jgi:hypothetical protein
MDGLSSLTGSNSGGVTAQAAGDHAALVLKKVQDVRQSEAQALVSLISNAAPGGNGGVGSIISYYA